ncbi:hypothetical protein TrLO_g11484 [Triparma laevis f. longispina]|uniref:Uncharacterized protein n=1 Tax=Triparma laevis f. longispina TaxID=1714387 RepID=A0A9W7F6I9_9STRA|nr:hypothetical protein TrLO_g11484 [Triparma laevis f. longispina]
MIGSSPLSKKSPAALHPNCEAAHEHDGHGEPGGGAGQPGQAEPGDQFCIVVVNSGGDVANDVATRYDTSVPTPGMITVEKENQKKFLIEIAKKHRTLAKMSRIGVAVKILLTLSLGYLDVITDFLVVKSYYDLNKLNQAYATAGLGFLVEGATVWMGKEDTELMLSGLIMYATLKAIEIALESIPESIL